MLIYTQGMYIMHVPFNPSEENTGSQTLYIPGLTFLFNFVLKKTLFSSLFIAVCYCLYFYRSVELDFSLTSLSNVGSCLY